MTEMHPSLGIPASLADALKSRVRLRVLAHELAAKWSALPIVADDPALTRGMAEDIAKARSELLPPPNTR